MSETPESVLAGLPQWSNAIVSPLEGGQTSHTWLVDAGKRKAVLKIDAAPRQEPYNPRPIEAQIQTRAAQRGLASRVLLATDTVYMTDYIEGDVWSPDRFREDANIQQLARSLRRLHALPLTGRTFDAIGAARSYARQIKGGDESKVRECLVRIENGPRPTKLCCCHNDLVTENIISTPETRFIDWEYACDNDPLFDLAIIAAHHDLTDTQCGTLLQAYFDGNGEQWRERLTRQSQVYRCLLYLWERARAGKDGQIHFSRPV